MKWLLGLTLAALGLTLTACGSGHNSTTQAGRDNGSRPGAALSVAQNPAQGAILVDSKGRTLYLFEQDNGTTSACTGACAQVWPALTAGASPTAGSGVDVAKLATANGQVAQQVTYSGHLLYSYSGDAAPGDVKGVGIPGWYPVSPSGAKVDKDEGKSSGGGSGGGY
jgi:predicted lipoprotein with Yx(FWY)xxD motif